MVTGLVVAFLSILAIDAGVYGQSVWVLIPAYAALASVVISSAILDNTFGSLVLTSGSAVVTMLSALGAWFLSYAINAVFIPSVCAYRLLLVFYEHIAGLYSHRTLILATSHTSIGCCVLVLNTTKLPESAQAIKPACQ